MFAVFMPSLNLASRLVCADYWLALADDSTFASWHPHFHQCHDLRARGMRDLAVYATRHSEAQINSKLECLPRLNSCIHQQPKLNSCIGQQHSWARAKLSSRQLTSCTPGAVAPWLSNLA